MKHCNASRWIGLVLAMALPLISCQVSPQAQALAPGQKHPWAHSDEIPWANPGTMGPGTATTVRRHG